MEISKGCSKALRNMINERIKYRSGPQIIEFFNQFGLNKEYQWGGSPSRWKITDDILEEINGTEIMDRCIETLFNPINFIEDKDKFDELFPIFNEYLSYEGYEMVLVGKKIKIQNVSDKEEKSLPTKETTDEKTFFLSHASEDKDLVRSVYNKLGAWGIEAWFDEAEILPGDNLVRKVFNGFSNSKYVVIFISKSFLSKPWPIAELETAVSKQIRIDSKLIIPFLLDVTFDELVAKFPFFEQIYTPSENQSEKIVEVLLKQMKADVTHTIKSQPSTNNKQVPDIRVEKDKKTIEHLLHFISFHLFDEIFSKPDRIRSFNLTLYDCFMEYYNSSTFFLYNTETKEKIDSFVSDWREYIHYVTQLMESTPDQTICYVRIPMDLFKDKQQEIDFNNMIKASSKLKNSYINLVNYLRTNYYELDFDAIQETIRKELIKHDAHLRELHTK